MSEWLCPDCRSNFPFCCDGEKLRREAEVERLTRRLETAEEEIQAALEMALEWERKYQETLAGWEAEANGEGHADPVRDGWVGKDGLP